MCFDQGLRLPSAASEPAPVSSAVPGGTHSGLASLRAAEGTWVLATQPCSGCGGSVWIAAFCPIRSLIQFTLWGGNLSCLTVAGRRPVLAHPASVPLALKASLRHGHLGRERVGHSLMARAAEPGARRPSPRAGSSHRVGSNDVYTGLPWAKRGSFCPVGMCVSTGVSRHLGCGSEPVLHRTWEKCSRSQVEPSRSSRKVPRSCLLLRSGTLCLLLV